MLNIVVSWTRSLGRGCRANYKQAVAEHMRGGAKTKDKKLLSDINELIAV